MAIKIKTQIHRQPFALPRETVVAPPAIVPFEDVSHIPGQPAAIRFFDQQSKEDLTAMREIVQGKLVRRWMDDTTKLSWSDYRDWVSLTDNSFLFAVLDAHGENVKNVRGFVYIYSERGEKFRVRRMEKLGFFKPADEKRYMLEISFASRPMKYGVQSGSGLMSSSVRQSCLQVRTLLSNIEKTDVVIFAFCDQGNIGSQRTVESAGFERRGMMKYDADSEEESILYVLNWRALQKKIKDRFLEVVRETS